MGEAKKKQIKCPVVGRRIKPAECGENRGSEYDCPADCLHNPWSPENYDRALEINDRYTEKILARLRAEHIEWYGYPTEPSLGEDPDEFTFLEWFSGQFFRERDGEGRTFKERWKAERYRGLNNDQRVMFEAEAGMQAAVLEIQQVPDDQSVVATDLLDPDGAPFLVLDRSLASTACRFTTLFAMVYRMPHYTRIHSAAVPLPDVTGMGMREVFSEITTHLDAPAELPALREWLVNNLRHMVDAIRAVTSARHEALLRKLDASYTKAVYDLRCKPEKFQKVLQAQKDMEPEEVMTDEAEAGFEAEWICLAGDSPTGQGQTMVGRILLHREGYIQLEASSEARTRQLKERVEGLFGDMVGFSRERTDDMAVQLLEKKALSHDPALVPESLMRNITQVETTTSRIPIKENLSKEDLELRMEREYMETFLGNSVPALDGLTPHQAAKDPSVRPKLVELMKSHARKQDENNLRTGRNTDINWMLEELGLDDINFPSPPPRGPLDDCGSDEESGFPDATPMLTEEQIAVRSRELEEAYETDYLLECFEKGYPFVSQGLDEMCEELDLTHLRRKLAELAAWVCFQQLDPDPRPVAAFTEALFSEQLAISVEYVTEGDMGGLFASLDQPFIAGIVQDRLEDILPLGLLNDNYGNCFLYLISLSEAIDALVYEAMELMFRELGTRQDSTTR